MKCEASLKSTYRKTMEHNAPTCDKKLAVRAKSCNAPQRIRGERRAFAVNEAVRSLDLALCRLRRGRAAPEPISVRRGITMADMLTDTKNSTSNTPGMDNTSLMSMDFSHYELVRNLSRSNCNSEGAVSGSASTFGLAERSMKDEHLERYFRSAELWTHRRRDPTNNLRFDLPEK